MKTLVSKTQKSTVPLKEREEEINDSLIVAQTSDNNLDLEKQDKIFLEEDSVENIDLENKNTKIDPIKTIINDLDVEKLIEEEATAAGLGGAGGADNGHGFVVLGRINEGVDPINYEFQFNPTDPIETIRGTGDPLTEDITPIEPDPIIPKDPNTLLDGDETIGGIYNTLIQGNLLENTEKQDGETYSITEFTINGNSYTPGDPVIIENIGTFNVGSNGDWSFSPNQDYEGAIPVLTYTVFDGDMYNNSTLTISDILAPVLPPDPILPTVGLDLEVDPGLEKLEGNSTNSNSIAVILTGTDGSSYTFNPIVNSDGSWSVDLTDIVFNKDISYVATATATNNDGTATATDIDSYTVIVPPDPILPTVGLDLEVDPGLEKLEGNSTNSNSIAVRLTGTDGSSYTFNPIVSSDGSWSVDLSDIIFNKDIVYVATATATNNDGTATATDIDSYTVIVPPDNTLVDDDENVAGIFNTTVSGNLLDNTEKQVGESYSITEFTINGVTYQPGNTVNISNVGMFTLNGIGDWSFTPIHGYEGPVPIVEYKVFDGDLSDPSTLTITDISGPEVNYNLGDWFISQSGNDNTTQYFDLIEGDSKKSSMDFNVQIKGESDAIPEGAIVKIAFDITGSANVNEDFTLDVDSNFYNVNYFIENNQLIVELSGGSGSLNGLPLSVTVNAIGDNDFRTESFTMDISNISLILEDGREINSGSWETNDSINFNIISPTTEFEATSDIDTLGNQESFGVEIFSWGTRELQNQEDIVLNFNSGDKLDFQDLLATSNHTFDFNATNSDNGTLITVTDMSSPETLVQEILLTNYFAEDLSKLVTDLRTTGSYEA